VFPGEFGYRKLLDVTNWQNYKQLSHMMPPSLPPTTTSPCRSSRIQTSNVHNKYSQELNDKLSSRRPKSTSMAANAAPSTLTAERRKASFRSDALLTLLAGGEAHLKLKNVVEDQISRDEVCIVPASFRCMPGALGVWVRRTFNQLLSSTEPVGKRSVKHLHDL